MSLVVRIVAPIGRDGEMLVAALARAGIPAEVCLDLRAFLADRTDDHLGPLLLTEEALTADMIGFLSEHLRQQPSWSDLPILILTTSGHETEHSRQLERDRMPLGSPVLLERPIRMATLVSSVRAAVRARGRQYEVQSALRALDRTAAELQAEQETLRAIIDNMPVGLLVASKEGEILLGNRTIESIFRHAILPSQDFESHGEWVSFHEDGRRVKGEEYPLARAIHSGQPVPAEDYLYQRGDGTHAWVRLSAAPVLDREGGVTGGVVAVLDVDEERKASDTLRRSEERFRLLMERASVGVAIGDMHGTLFYMNPALQQMLQYSAEDLHAGSVRLDELTPEEFKDSDRLAMQQLQQTGASEPYQKALYGRSGTEVPLLVGAVRLPSPTSALREEVAFFMTDLRSQKQAEAALVQSEKLAAVGRLAASISHEINNPLEAVTNLLYIVLSEPLPDSARGYLQMASEEVARVSQIAGQTLRFHRQATHPRSVTPQDLLDPVLALYQGRMNNALVTAQSEHRGKPQFLCYEGDIRQVLNNLVGNAIDAMRGKGTLRIRSRAATHMSSGVAGVRITVADNGHGMKRETAQRIFEPFYTTKGIHGTGLGLWISHGIVTKHQGSLVVRSRMAEPGEGGRPGGTVFSLFLPAEPHIKAEAVPAAEAA